MLEEKTISKKEIYDGVVINLSVEEVLLPNGEISTREIVKIRDSVGIIAINKEGKIIMVKQYRKAIESMLYEIPAGTVDDGEDALSTAKRELLEETGYSNGEIILVGEFYSSPGTNRTKHSIFLAKDVEKVSNDLDLDRDEFLVVEELSFKQLDELYVSGELTDLKTAYAYLYLKCKND